MRLGLTTLVGLLALALAQPALAAPLSPGLVAAYSFDEGSGASAVDATGNGHAGAISGATWSEAGRYGGALSFDGIDDSVSLGSLGTFYRHGFTLEAWVRKTGPKNDVAVVGTWAGSGPMLWVDHLAGRHHLTLDGGLSSYLDSGRSPAPGEWQHLAATFDGTTARYYVDGAEVASRTVASGAGSSDVWRIGAYGSSPGGFFDGLIDDVRIYDRALSASEVLADRDQPVTIANADTPTAPGDAEIESRSKTSLRLAWSPSTDDVAVTGYRVFKDGVELATTTSTAHTVAGLTCSTSYELGVEAFDADGNTSERVLVGGSTSLCQGPQGLVASYPFDEGSGTVAGDSSGNGRAGTISGATWTTGLHGGALAFDGSDDSVSLGSLGTFYQQGFTLQAWVRKSGAKRDAAVVGTWAGSGPMLWVDHQEGRHRLTLTGGMSSYLDSGRTPAVDRWQHLAATYDGTTARYFVDGVEVASRAASGGVGSSNVWRIGAYGSSPGGFFDGVIDDVRIYDRPLSAGEIRTDMNQPAPPEDTAPPSAPGALDAVGAIERATLTWGAAVDDVHVTRYNVHRSTTKGFTPTAANRVAQPTGTTFDDAPLAAATYYYRVTAEDAAGNVGAATDEASAVVAPDTSPPTVALTSPSTGGTISGSLTLRADADDDQGVAGVRFLLDGREVGDEDATAPYALDWDTRGELNGDHELTAVARDTAGNETETPVLAVRIENAGVSASGLRAAYGLDDGSGELVRDSSQQHRTGNLAAGAWAAGRFGGAASLGGDGRVDLPALGTFYRSAFTLEAWVYKQGQKRDVGIVGTWVASAYGGAMIWIDHANGRYHLTLGDRPANYLDSGKTAAVGRWQHVAATYDGTTARIYLDGVQAASTPFSGNLGTSNTWRIGAYGSPATGALDGVVDNVRIYDRALTASEVAVNMSSRVQPDRTPPGVVSTAPEGGAADVDVGRSLTVEFDEPMAAESLDEAFTLTDPAGDPAPFGVAYDAATSTATLKLLHALEFGTTYRATVRAGVAADLAGNTIGADVSWTFTTATSPPPVLLATSPANPFGDYTAEILRSEGLSSFATIDAALLTPSLLGHFDVVVLGEAPLGQTQVATLTDWVTGGGNLIALRPDKKLAPLLGLSDTGGTLAEAYLRVHEDTAPGAGIVHETIQFHGTADRYSLAGATAVATLYADAATPTTAPAVTLRSVGAAGGQAAAFTYDLARSVVLTRQGNPAWAGQERDGSPGIRPSDMFFGAAAGDAQRDWIDTSRISIPQADEQQRLLLNLITLTAADRTPLPRFWYLPRGEKAVVVMSGDDHSQQQAPGGTASHFSRYLELDPEDCSVVDWECVRATSYVYTNAKLTNSQAALYSSLGFEVALHPVVASCPTQPRSEAELDSVFDTQIAAFLARYSSQPSPATSRTHCVFWPDWATKAKVERAHGIRLDANYYHYPPAWVGSAPGFMNGGGFPMRFADLDGSVIDVYQQNTNLTDETNASIAADVATLLDNALGPQGYFGAFGANMHTDGDAPHPGAEAIVAAAQARGVPVISYAQLLAWLDGRNGSSLHGLAWSGSTLTFDATVAPGARGLQALLPAAGPSGTLVALTRNGAAVPYTLETVKGVEHARFGVAAGSYRATYGSG